MAQRLAVLIGLVIAAGSILAAATPRASAYQLTVSNTGQIFVPDVGQAIPYPSEIPVAWVTPGSYNQGLQVSLNSVTGSTTQGLSFLVQAPSGATFVPLARVGGFQNGQSWTVAGAGNTITCGAGTLGTGTYLPTLCGSTPTFPGPAPSGPFGSFAAADDGDPNGTWKLYVVDDTAGGAGGTFINAGWSLKLELLDPECSNCSSGQRRVRRCGGTKGIVEGGHRRFRVTAKTATIDYPPTHLLSCKKGKSVLLAWMAKCLPLSSDVCRLKGPKVPKGVRRFLCRMDFDSGRPPSRAIDAVRCFAPGNKDAPGPLSVDGRVKRSKLPFAPGFKKK